MNNKKCIVIAKDAPQKAKKNLKNMGYCVIQSAPLSNVNKALKYHPDMQLVKGDKCYICAPECYEYYKPYFEMLNIRLVKGSTTPEEKYPFDVCYNVAVVGNYAVHNFNYTDKQFLKHCAFKHIDVKQGYSKCSLCVVSSNAVITADEGIAKTLENFGIEVLKVSAGNVKLEPYEYGFIGGASGLIDKNKLAFCGDVSLHPDYKKIKDFCLKHGVEIIGLTSGQLVDVGTIILLG